MVSLRPRADAMQPLLLEIGLLHQPVGHPAEEIGVRAAAIEAARPQPGVVGEQEGDAALALAIEDQERTVTWPCISTSPLGRAD